MLRRAADGTVTEVVRRAVERPHGRARVRRRRVVGRAAACCGSPTGRRSGCTASAPDGAPVALTPEPAVPRGLRYADGDVSPDGSTLLCVQEEHPVDGGEAVNTIVRLDAGEPSVPEVVVSGPGLRRRSPLEPRRRGVLLARVGPPGHAVGRHPAGRRSRRAAHGRRRRRRAGVDLPGGVGARRVAVVQRRPHRVLEPVPLDGRRRARRSMVDLGRDIGFPQWVFGESCFAFLDGGRVAFTYVEDGARPAGRPPARRPTSSRSTCRSRSSTGCAPTGRGWPSSAPRRRPRPTSSPSTSTAPRPGAPGRRRRRRATLGIDPAWFSVPEPIDFPTAGGAVAHALYYPPRHPDVRGPDGERPPLLVVIHGGPTSAARAMLRLSYQYWTTRGFAVVDVNYRGLDAATGGTTATCCAAQWGVADVEDCAAVCRFLVERGDVDPDRLCIRGGSAGGFTTLAALAFQDVFCGRRQPLRRRRPRRPGPRHAQVREPLPRRAGRPVAGGPGRVRGAVADLPRRHDRPAAGRVPGPRGRGRAAEPGRDDRRRRAGQGRAGGLRGVRGRAARLPPGRQHPRRPRRRAVVLQPGAALRAPRRRGHHPDPRRQPRPLHRGLRDRPSAAAAANWALYSAA